MFRQMRRAKQQLSLDENIEILNSAAFGVLSLNGKDYPYGVPVNYAYKDNAIYIHSALSGEKIDRINDDNKVSFSVVGQCDIISEKFTSYYKSVIVFGVASILIDANEKQEAIRLICNKYSKDQSKTNTDKEINGSIDAMAIIKISIDYMSGKQAKEFVNK